MSEELAVQPSATALQRAGVGEGLIWVLLQVLTSQAFAIWLAFTGTLEFPDYQLLILGEIALLSVPTLLFSSREGRSEGLQQFALKVLVVLPALFLFNALLVHFVMSPTHAPPPWAVAATAAQRLLGDNLRPSLLYLALSGGLALARALRSPAPERWWHENMLVEHGAVSGAFLLMLFLLAPLIMLRQQNAWVQSLSPHTMNLVLIALMLTLRVVLITLSRFMRLTQVATLDAGASKPKSRKRRKLR